MASNLGIFILVRNFANRQIRDSNFTNSNITISFLFLYEILQIDKFEIQILQIQILQYYFQILVPKYPNQEFLVTNLKIFYV